MTLLNRPTLVDRPEVVNRGNGEDEQDDEQTEGIPTETLGEGGGPTIHHIEFEPGDYHVVAGANATAVLATGEQEGDFFEQAFINAAIQLKDLQDAGENIRDVSRFGLEKGVGELGLSMEEINTLRDIPEDESGEIEEVEVEGESETVEDEESGDPDEVENIEEDIEDIKE